MKCPQCGGKMAGTQKTNGKHRKCVNCQLMTAGKHDEVVYIETVIKFDCEKCEGPVTTNGIVNRCRYVDERCGKAPPVGVVWADN